MPSSPPIRVIVIDDHQLVRAGISAQLSGAGDDFEVVAEAGSLAEAQLALAAGGVDVAIVDHQLGDTSGQEVLAWLRDQHPRVRVLILSAFPDSHLITDYMIRGADGFIAKTVRRRELREHVAAVAAGRKALDAASAEAMVTAVRTGVPAELHPAGPDLLTAREKEILTLVATGLRNEQIATTLYISPDTVKTHLARAYRKLGVNTRAAAVSAAARAGLVQL